MSALPSDPIEAVIARHYVPPQPRCGDNSGRLWWVCPFHDDRNPSLCVVPGKGRYHCFGCGAHGDAIDFLRRLNPGMSYSDAASAVGGRSPKADPPPASRREPCPRPDVWEDFAQDVVASAEAALWSERGDEARSYLLGRGLLEYSIRQARLGFWPDDEWVAGVFSNRKVWVPPGIVIPWFNGSSLDLINIRRLKGEPKYLAIRGSRRGGMYPGPHEVIPGKAVVIVEGEFDALLLKQELSELVPVVTLGSASCRPSPRVMSAMLGAYPWIVAADADDAGDRSVEGWLALSDRSVRISPPSGLGKDWTDAHRNGLGLRAWWVDALDRFTHGKEEAVKSEASQPKESTPSCKPPKETGPLDYDQLVEPSPYPWREDLAWWSVDWRLRWGGLANAYIAAGMPWKEAEERAASEALAERAEAGGGPPPTMTPHPETAFCRDWLADLLNSGEATHHLSSSELEHAAALPDQEPLDRNAIRSAVQTIRDREWAERYRSRGLFYPGNGSLRWQCENPYCLDKTRWWMSAQGIVNCRNCRAPSFPDLVVAEGNSLNSPCVEPGRSRQAASHPCGRSPDFVNRNPEPCRRPHQADLTPLRMPPVAADILRLISEALPSSARQKEGGVRGRPGTSRPQAPP
jgi:hypothetical protein